MKFITTKKIRFGFMNVIVSHSDHSHSRDHFQGGESKNTNIFIMYRDHSTV
jgi:hypothetical protein